MFTQMSIKWFVFVVILVLGIAWAGGPAFAQGGGDAENQSADDYTTQLDHLRALGQAANRLNRERAVVLDFSSQLARLGELGRATGRDKGTVMDANLYISYLDTLNQMGRAASGEVEFVQKPARTANDYITHLENLRHLGEEPTLAIVTP